MVTLWYLWYVEVLGYFFFWLEKSYRWNLICLANVYSIWWLGPLDVHYLSVNLRKQPAGLLIGGYLGTVITVVFIIITMVG